MDEFIRAQVKELKRTPNVRLPKPAQCMIVTKLARQLARRPRRREPEGPARLARRRAGGLSVSADLRPSGATEHHWVFYSRPRHELVELLATGIEPGVTLQLTTDAIKERYDPARSSPSELECLWEARDWAALETLSLATLVAYGKDRDTPALVFLGGALVETGRRGEGLALVDEYMKSFAPHWTMNFTGIGYYYQALELLARGEKERGTRAPPHRLRARPLRAARRRAREAHRHAPPARGAALARQAVSGRLPPAAARRRRGRRSRSTGRSPASGPISCSPCACWRATAATGPTTTSCAATSTTRRGSPASCPALHVVTMEKERYPDRPQYFKAEDEVRAASLPMELLLEDGELSAAVQQTGSPFIVLLDRARRVRYEGELASVDLWDTLASVSTEPA